MTGEDANSSKSGCWRHKVGEAYSDGGRTELDGFERVFDLEETSFGGECASS